MLIIKTEAFKTLVIRTSSDNFIYHYNSFDDFIKILRNNCYHDIMNERNFLN